MAWPWTRWIWPTSARIQDIWEEAVTKLRGRLMPPAGQKQPAQTDVDAVRRLPGNLDRFLPEAAAHWPCADPAPEPCRVRGIDASPLIGVGHRRQEGAAHRSRGRRLHQYRQRSGGVALLHGAVPVDGAPRRTARRRRTGAEDGQGDHSGHAGHGGATFRWARAAVRGRGGGVSFTLRVPGRRRIPLQHSGRGLPRHGPVSARRRAPPRRW